MTPEASNLVQAAHLARKAYLYVRQSSPRQVVENTESTRRQYALRERAEALGWSADQVVVIDSDQGLSGTSAADRQGFQRIVTEVSMGRAGLVIGLEVNHGSPATRATGIGWSSCAPSLWAWVGFSRPKRVRSEQRSAT